MDYKPFVKRVWWKRQLLEQFKDLYPKDFNEYYEPFVGGWAVFFDLRINFWSEFTAHLFDLNEELVVTYNVVKDDTDKLIQLLKNFKSKHSKDFFMEIRWRDKNENFKNEKSKIERAARFIYLNRTCFNWMYRVNLKGEFNVPFWKYSNPKICDEEWLYLAKEALQNTTIENADFSVVEKQAKKWDFVYFDPPYDVLTDTANFTDYNKWWFGRDEQVRLFNTFDKLSKKGCYTMLSNHNTPFIRDLYESYRKEIVLAKRMINSDATKRWAIEEIVVLNYKN